jgi:hypothetical protein
LPAARKPDSLQGFTHATPNNAVGHPEDFEGDGYILEDGPTRYELEILKYDADVAPQIGNGTPGETTDIAPQEEDAPLVHLLRCVNHPQKGALARSRRARDEHKFTSRNVR